MQSKTEINYLIQPQQTNNKGKTARTILYIGMAGSAMDPQIIGINLGFIQLSIFRLALAILLVVFASYDFGGRYSGTSGSIYSLEKPSYISRRSYNLAQVFMLIWLLYALISVIWAKDSSLWLKNVFYLCVGNACCWIVPPLIARPEHILDCLRSFTFMNMVHNAIGWYEVITGNYYFLTTTSRAWVYASTRAPASLFGGENTLATFLVFSVIFTLVYQANCKSKFIKFLCWVSVISSVLLLFRTSSRGNIFGLIVAIVIMLHYTLIIGRKRPAMIMALLIGTLAIMYICTCTSILSTTLEKLNIDFLSSKTSSDVIRLNLIKSGFSYLIDTYFIGVGAGNSSYWLQSNAPYYTGNINVMHNYWIEILVDYGILIFMLFVTFFVKTLWSLSRIYKTSKSKLPQTLALGFICCLAAFVPCSLSGSSYLGYDWLWLFWGLVLAVQKTAIYNNVEN